MERRPNTLKGNSGFLTLFLLLAVACSTRFALTDQIRMDLYPIPLMIVVYLGYKLGRKAGVIAGLICSWFWTIIFILYDSGFTWSQILLNGVALKEETNASGDNPQPSNSEKKTLDLQVSRMRPGSVRLAAAPYVDPVIPELHT
jgi:hypothetical protein